jgi:hypothetical protein
VAIGSNDGIGNWDAPLRSNTTGFRNVAVGGSCLVGNTTGGTNVGIGFRALGSNTTGAANIAIGSPGGQAGIPPLGSNSTGSSNIAIGNESLAYNTTNDNIAIGANSLWQNTTGNQNIGVGVFALNDATTATTNTAIGHFAGDTTTTGSNNSFLGNGAVASSATVSNTITLGNSSIATLRCQVTTITSLSDARDKTNVADLSAGLEFVNALRPVSFEWNMRDGGKVGEQDTGFIAQDLQAVQEATGVQIPGLVFADNPEKLEAGYGKLIPVLVKAIQELTAQVETLKAEMAALKGT